AALRILDGVPRAQCQAPIPTGTNCVEPIAGDAETRTLTRGIASFSVTYANEPGSYIAYFGRTSSGDWGYWFGAQDQQSPLTTLPGELLACAGPAGGLPRVLRSTSGASETLQPLTRLTAESFVLTHPGTPATDSNLEGMRGLGWYHLSAPIEGWVPEQDATAAVLGDCMVHDIQYGLQDTLPAGGEAMDLVGTVWTWQQTTLNNDEVVTPDDPNKYTIEFLPEGRVTVLADCNRGGGTYTVEDNQLTIGPLALTLVACPPASFFDQFTRQLNDVSSFFMRDGSLFLTLKLDSGTMRFAPAGPAEDTVTGVVTYRVRIALPPDAVVTVRIEDVSRADGPARVIGEQVIATEGRQVPIPFSIGYRPSEIDPRFRYNVRAQIRDGSGRLLFTTTTAHPVITQGNPTKDIEVVVEMVGG
ncbi:MAG: YbaY family lipoprotein, partial [Dehalococcoidia bacterium]